MHVLLQILVLVGNCQAVALAPEVNAYEGTPHVPFNEA